MSGVTAGDVLEMLAEWIEHHDRQMQAGDDRDIRAFNAAESDASRVKYKLLALKASDIRALAAALIPPAPASAGQRMAALTAAALATGKRVTIEIMQPKNPAEEEPFVAYVDGPGKAWRHVRNGPDLEEVLHAALHAYSHRITLKPEATP